MRAGMNFRRRG